MRLSVGIVLFGLGVAPGSISGQSTSAFRFDSFFSESAAPDHRVYAIAPAVWWNDATDVTLAFRIRSNHGRNDRITAWLSRGFSGLEHATVGDGVDGYIKWENPSLLNSSDATRSLELWSQDGTTGARVVFVETHGGAASSFPSRYSAWSAQWVATRETNFLERTLWENAGTVEVGRLDDLRFDVWNGEWRVRLDYRAGLTYSKPGSRTTDPKPFLRVTASGSLRKPIGPFVVGIRAFAGGYLADDPPVLQRRIPVDGADPYETLGNPLVRTQGAPLAGNDVVYHSPGNGNLRGFRPGIGGRWMLGGTLELEKVVIKRTSGVFRSASIVGFGDAALVDSMAVSSNFGKGATPVSDAGVGVRFGLRIGDIAFPIRVEFPLFVSEPDAARERIPGGERVGFRWLISFQPIF